MKTPKLTTVPSAKLKEEYASRYSEWQEKQIEDGPRKKRRAAVNADLSGDSRVTEEGQLANAAHFSDAQKAVLESQRALWERELPRNTDLSSRAHGAGAAPLLFRKSRRRSTSTAARMIANSDGVLVPFYHDSPLPAPPPAADATMALVDVAYITRQQAIAATLFAASRRRPRGCRPGSYHACPRLLVPSNRTINGISNQLPRHQRQYRPQSRRTYIPPKMFTRTALTLGR